MALFVASTSSSAAAVAGGIRISDGAPVKGRKPWVSLGLDGDDHKDGMEAALARARDCDVYVGHGGGVRRMVAWLRAELEMLGVPCVASDRRRCGDAPSQAAARAAMDVATAGVVVVTPASLANPYAIEEIRIFADRGALVPVLVGLSRGDLAAVEDVVEKRGDLWAEHGGHPWKTYDGKEAEWRAAVEGLSRAEPAVVFGVGGDVRDRVLDVLDILGARLGRRAVVAAVRNWRASSSDPELPFPRNADFVGRVKELLHVESLLRGPTTAYAKSLAEKMALRDRDDELVAVDQGPFMNGVICISGASGVGKTELALEFAHRHASEYKRVFWLHGEPRYLRQSYLKLADHLGVDIGDDVVSQPPDAERSRRSLPDIEGDAIAKIQKELTRDIPYLVVIDNLESEKDWWDGRTVHELLPRAGSMRMTHIVITTRLGHRLRGIRTLALGNLAMRETMRLMMRTRACSVEDMAILRSIEEKVGGLALGIALVGAIMSELDVGPGGILLAMSGAPHRAPTWASKDDPVLRDNPGLVQLLDASLVLLDREPAGLGAAVARLLEASSFFAPAPIPEATLARVACSSSAGEGSSLWKRLMQTLPVSCTSPRTTSSFAGQDELESLVRLGFARRCAKPGHVSVHCVFRQFSRKIGSGQVGRSVVRAIAAATHDCGEHAWAACLSVFRFEAPAVAVELPNFELARFVKRSVLPLAARAVETYSAYSAALELLREATDTVRGVEDQYGRVPRRGASSVDLDPRGFEELALARAELLMARARMMVRAGEYAIAKDHCLTAIDNLEVLRGDEHPETQAAREFFEKAVSPNC